MTNDELRFRKAHSHCRQYSCDTFGLWDPELLKSLAKSGREKEEDDQEKPEWAAYSAGWVDMIAPFTSQLLWIKILLIYKNWMLSYWQEIPALFEICKVQEAAIRSADCYAVSVKTKASSGLN